MSEISRDGELQDQVGADTVMAARLDDVDAVTEVVRGWDLDFCQLDRGRIEARLAHVSAGSVFITECAMNRRVEQFGAAPKGFLTVAVPVRDDMDIRWRGEAHVGSKMMLFQPGGNLDCITDALFHVYTVSVSESFLHSAAENRESKILERFAIGSGVISCSKHLRQRLRMLIMRLIHRATASQATVSVRLRFSIVRFAGEEEKVKAFASLCDDVAAVGGARHELHSGDKWRSQHPHRHHEDDLGALPQHAHRGCNGRHSSLLGGQECQLVIERQWNADQE